MNSYELPLSASGSILRELSKNIPSSKFALLELIKNSYEAGAKKVNIELANDYLTIKDDGSGISQKDLSALLKISYSNKKFGQIVNNRIISGEKGLGFYSAFKFGNQIVVESICENIKTTFKLVYTEIEKCENLIDYKIPITIEPVQKDSGTIIKILDINKESLDFLRNMLLDPNSKKKIEKAIIPNKKNDEFVIEIFLKDTVISEERKYIDTKPYRIANLIYKNKGTNQEINNIIDIYTDDDEIENIKISIPNEFLPLITNKYIEFDINIEYFNFSKVKPKLKIDNIDPLFISTSSKKITPLVYINNALFDNYQLYDVEKNVSLKSSKVIRQQIGFIHILITKDHIIEFNSDRTAINESKIQILLKKFLDFISSESQIRIKEAKKKVTKKERKTLPSIFRGGDSPNLNYILSNAKIIKIEKNGEKVCEFNNQLTGEWVIETENEIIEITILEYLLPSIQQKEKKCETFKLYNIDDFFTFYNSENKINISLKPTIEFLDTDLQKIKFNKQNGNIEFLHSGEFKLKITLYDKVSKLSFNDEFILVAEKIFQNIENNDSTKKNNDFLQLLINSKNKINFKSDVHCFINEINDIYLLSNYDNIFVSSIRTLVELVVCDIEDIHNESSNDLQKIDIKEASLSPRYEEIMKIIINSFPGFISSNSENVNRKKISGIINSIKKEYMAEGLVSFLNLATHQGTRLIEKKDIELRKLVFCLLITYLNEISN